MPQVLGAVEGALAHAREVLGAAINGVTDNPLIFGHDILSGGNFHAEPLALLSDYLAIAVAEIASMSERRTDLLDRRVNPALSMFLTTEPGLESGFMIAHVAAAALTSENRTLAHPASVDNVTTSAGQEDHVSMAPWAGFKLQRICANTAHVLAIEAARRRARDRQAAAAADDRAAAARARARPSQRRVPAVRSPARPRHRDAGRADRTPRADEFRDMTSDAVVLLIAIFGLLLLALACQRLFRARFVAAAGSGTDGSAAARRRGAVLRRLAESAHVQPAHATNSRSPRSCSKRAVRSTIARRWRRCRAASCRCSCSRATSGSSMRAC